MWIFVYFSIWNCFCFSLFFFTSLFLSIHSCIYISRLDRRESVSGRWQRGRQFVCDHINARCCLWCANARWHCGSLPSYSADCLCITFSSANTYGSPAATQCALQVSERLRRYAFVWTHVCITGNSKYVWFFLILWILDLDHNFNAFLNFLHFKDFCMLPSAASQNTLALD